MTSASGKISLSEFHDLLEGETRRVAAASAEQCESAISTCLLALRGLQSFAELQRVKRGYRP